MYGAPLSTVAERRSARSRGKLWLRLGIASALLLSGAGLPSQLFTIWGFASLAFCVTVLVDLAIQRRFALAAPLFFLLYGTLTPFIMNYVMGIPMSSWRAGYEKNIEFGQVLQLFMSYTLWAAAICTALSSILPAGRVGRLLPLSRSWEIPTLALVSVASVGLAYSALSGNRDSFAADQDVGTAFIQQFCALALLVGFTYAIFYVPRGFYRTVAISLSFVIAALAMLSGFRSIGVMIGGASIFYLFKTNRLRVRTVMLISITGLALYILLLFSAATRQLGMSSREAINAIGSGVITLDKAFGYVGAAEQINMMALAVYTRSATFLLYGQTYYDALLRILPNALHRSLFDTIRAQDYIVSQLDFAHYFVDLGLNIGAQMYIEAVINFGRFGPYPVIAVVFTFLAVLEWLSTKGVRWAVFYICVASLGFVIAWYGSANYLKQFATVALIGMVLPSVIGLPFRLVSPFRVPDLLPKEEPIGPVGVPIPQ